MSTPVDITGLPKAQVLAALFNAAAAPRRMGVFQYHTGPFVMDEEWAEMLTTQDGTRLGGGSLDFDYLHGRGMKVDLSGDSFDPWGFDDINGASSAQRAVDHLRQTGEVTIAPTCDGKTWLQTVTNESLRRFDEGDSPAAIINFLTGTAKHPKTRWIPEWEATSPILLDGLSRGRQALKRAMMEFTV